MYRTMENTYATIKLQVLPNLLTPVLQGKKGTHFLFESRLLYVRLCISLNNSVRMFYAINTNIIKNVKHFLLCLY
jgi:hypothetical protein